MFGLIFFITQFPSLITHHSSLKIPNPFGTIIPVWHHHSLVITQYFLHYLWVSHLSHDAGFFFIFSITEPSEKKKKKKKPKQPTQEKKGRKKKSKVVKRDGWYCLWVPYVCLITILLLSYELWKLKTAKMCFQFP